MQKVIANLSATLLPIHINNGYAYHLLFRRRKQRFIKQHAKTR